MRQTVDMAILVPFASIDTGRWEDEFRAERELVDDRILDPWAEATDRADA
jgi:hypothetical protein